MPSKHQTWTVQEVQAVFGFRSNETLRLWRKQGCPHEIVRGRPRFHLPEVIEWIRERDRKHLEPKDLEEAEKRRAIAEAQLAELKLKREEGKVIDRESVKEAAGTMFAQFRVQALTLPQRWAPRVVGVKGLPEVTALLEAAVLEALTALSEEDLCPPQPS